MDLSCRNGKQSCIREVEENSRYRQCYIWEMIGAGG